MSALSEVKALLFDVFGTVVDYHTSVRRQLETVPEIVEMGLDCGVLTEAWRSLYPPYMAKVENGELPWTNIDGLHQLALRELLSQRGLILAPERETQVTRFWHYLDPWPDVVPALVRLRRRLILGTLSNGNIELLVDMAKYGGLPWDVVFSAELGRKYKMNLDCYRYNAGLLQLPFQQIAMVAAHPADLERARSVGLKTIFVHRPDEHGSHQPRDPKEWVGFDFACEGLDALADVMGV